MNDEIRGPGLKGGRQKFPNKIACSSDFWTVLAVVVSNTLNAPVIDSFDIC
jgi:hypothetical protein